VEGGVNGGHAVMVPNILPPVQEVKYKDFVTTTSPGTPIGNSFTFVNSTLLAGIQQGTGPSDRIGRNIRVVGVVVRALMNTEVTVGTGGIYAPCTLDLVWDNQFNGVNPNVTDIYLTGPGNIVYAHSLPNPLFDNRFKFAKRLQIKQPQGSLNLIDFSYTCNKLVEYKASTGVVTDLSKCNLLLTACSPGDTTSAIEYSMRILYVDA